MYLEISPRQTGKTTRLLQSVKSFLYEIPTGIAHVISHSHASSNYLRDRVLKEMPAFLNGIRFASCNDVDVFYLLHNGNPVCNKLFCDEFAFFNSNFWNHVKSEKVEWGYFCSTANKSYKLNELTLSQDIIPVLLRHNDFSYVCKHSVGDVSGYLLSLPREAFELEILGNFIH